MSLECLGNYNYRLENEYFDTELVYAENLTTSLLEEEMNKGKIKKLEEMKEYNKKRKRIKTNKK